MKPIMLSVCFSLLAALPALGADYYVSTAGSDSNPGTQAQPFATINRALGAAQNGGTIHLDASTWNESPHMEAVAPGTGVIQIIGNYNGPNGPGGKYSSIINGFVWMMPTSAEDPMVASVYLNSVTVKTVYAFENFYSGLGPCEAIIGNCNIAGSTTHGVYCLIPNQQSRVIVTGCDISGCNGDGVHAPSKAVQKSARNPEVVDSVITNNAGNGVYFNIFDDPSFIYPGEVRGCTISQNSGDGIFIENTTAVFYNNEITNNAGYGVHIVGENAFPDFGGGAHSSVGGNSISGNGTYDLYKTGIQNIYVKNNHWDSATEEQMASGFQKRTNITRFYDAFDYWQTGDPLSGVFIWKADFPKNGLLDFAASRTNKVQVTTLGQLKAVYAR